MIDWLNENLGFVQTLSALITALIAGFAIWASFRQARRSEAASERSARAAERSADEARSGAEMLARAQIGALLWSGEPITPTSEAVYYFDVRNVGRLAADIQEVQVRIDTRSLIVVDPPSQLLGTGLSSAADKWGVRIKALHDGGAAGERIEICIDYSDPLGSHRLVQSFPDRREIEESANSA